MQNFTLSKLLLFLFMGMVSSVLYGQVTTFVYTGSQQTYTAEFSGDYQLEVWGAQGGAASPYAGGKGGYSSGIVHLTAGQTIYIYVGQSGRGPSQGTAWNGGGAGICCGAGGGGATDIRIGGTDLVDRIIVAGGGGGGSNDTPQGNGGDGGGLAGLSGTVGLPGTQSSGYQLGVGESNSFDAAGGGGGYWGGYDGGDGTGGSGGGGSGYIGELNSGETIAGNAIMPDPDGGTMTGNTGDGVAVVTRLCDVPELTVTPSDTVCLGTMVTITATSVNEGTYTWNNGITNGVPFFLTETTTYTALSSDEDDCEAVVTITVGDFTNPTPIAHNTTLYLDANGIATLTAAAVDDGSYDNCGIDTMYLSQDTFGCEDVGDLDVTLTVTDIQGNVDSAIVTVTVLDTISPVIVCQDATIALDETGYAKLSSGSKGKKVLLLWDTNNSSTQSLKTKIEEAGYEVTMPTVPEYQWNNTNPPLDDFDAVIHLDGTTYLNAMSSDAQLALVDFV
ncbi:MAG TPA: glycine rich domain-containing protein [Draconibacterium sp.]|nr:glycine rich domain-containing protein [Draconibacterium sp.]